ncbi:MAG: aldehyde dehydrogenase EutE [Phycisphaerae bacterium]|nr:aldehyde dehydrogenase EutE [Phycisphaerae bacterium]
MSPLTDQQIDQIARRFVQYVGGNQSQGTPPPTVAATPAGMPGVFAELDSAVNAATQAFEELDRMPLSTRDNIIAAMREAMLANAETLAREAVEETGLGRYEDKVIKNRLVARKTPGTEELVPQARSGDRGLTLMERAPFGVIGSITPCTNPAATIICNTIGMIAAGNSVVFNVHPAAKKVSTHNVALLNEAAIKAGGPANLVTTLANPTIETAQALMKHPGIALLVVTGGPGVVEAAMQSGKRAICAGPGNPPVVVDETADIALAGRGVVCGASFDNNVICTDEKEVFVVGSAADDLFRVMSQNGAVILNRSQAKQLENVIFQEIRGPRQAGVIERSLIGKNAGIILNKIGINAGDDVRLVVIDVDANHPLVWTEQLMPVLPVVRVSDVDEAIDLAVAAEGGCRHTAVMYSRNIDKLSRMARVINCSIFVKNGPCYSGLGEGGEGYTSFSIASPTGEGLTGPRAFSRERRCVLVDHFRIV